TGVVLARTGSTYRVDTDRGEVTATLRGRLKHQDGDRVVAGDVVDLDVPTGGEGGGGGATTAGVRPRGSVLAPAPAGGARRARGAGRGGEVEPPERALSGPESPDRGDQREMGHGEAHDPCGVARPAPRRGGRGGGSGLRGGHTGAARGGDVGDRSRAARRVLPRVPPVPRPVSLRQLPSSGRAGVRGARGGRSRDLRPRPARVLPAHLRGGQRSFLVQRAASREVTFCITRANASSRSIP